VTLNKVHLSRFCAWQNKPIAHITDNTMFALQNVF